MPNTKKPFYKKASFLRRQRAWYKKAEKKGFYDIEGMNWKTGEPHNRLFGTGFKSGAEYARQHNPHTQRYWELVSQRLWSMREEGTWSDEEIEVWSLWNDGRSVAAIHRIMGISQAKVKKMIVAQESLLKDHRDEYYDDLVDYLDLVDK